MQLRKQQGLGCAKGTKIIGGEEQVVGFQVDKLKEAALCALHALPAICALGDNWRAWRA